MSISVPDPSISATISINPMPAARAKDVETAGRNLLCLLAFSWGIEISFLSAASTACCSATKDVVTLSNGTLSSLHTRLKIEMDTPTAASSVEPDE
jgi:hypothetical protein